MRMCYAFGNIANHVSDSRQELASVATKEDDLFLKIASHYFNYLFKVCITETLVRNIDADTRASH